MKWLLYNNEIIFIGNKVCIADYLMLMLVYEKTLISFVYTHMLINVKYIYKNTYIKISFARKVQN